MTGTDLSSLLDLAVRSALQGGSIIRSSRPGGPAEAKGTGDYVTDVDRRSEDAITAILEQGPGDIPVLGEEEGGRRGDRYWLVDPLDGTTNFMHGFPVVAVSVALVEEGRPILGVVHAPFLEETYTGVRGRGARVSTNGGARPLRVSDRKPSEAIVATGFPFRDKSLVPRYLPVFEGCFESFEDLRRPGAAALDLAWSAAGVFDGFFELHLSPWDVAAGALLVSEAGGRVSDWEGGGTWLDTGNILAGNPAVHEKLLDIARTDV